MFTLGEMECMGSCVTGPMIAVADYTKGTQGFTYTYFEDLTPSTAVKVLEDLRAGRTPKVRTWPLPSTCRCACCQIACASASSDLPGWLAVQSTSGLCMVVHP